MIAVVADLHANIYALQAFLHYVQACGNVTQILNLGDFLQIGPHPAEVADVILSDARFVSVLGNNELSLLERDPSAFRTGEVAHQDWTIDEIGPARLERIRALPASRRLRVGQQSLLLAHEALPSILDETDADWVLCGHVHRQEYLRRCGKSYLNPGSLGCSFEKGRMHAAMIEAGGDGVTATLHSLRYDDSGLADDYRERHVPDADYILPRLYGGLQ